MCRHEPSPGPSAPQDESDKVFTGLPLVSSRASAAILMYLIAGAIAVGALVRWGYRVWVSWGVGR